MDALELISDLMRREIIRTEIPIGLQPGLPWLEKCNEKLCISFLMHKEEYSDNSLYYYTPQYAAAWVWPFEHIACFRNLMLEAPVDVSTPICRISADRLLSVGKYGMEDLYRACTEALGVMEKNNSIADAWIRSYQKKFLNLVDTLGMEELYKSRGV